MQFDEEESFLLGGCFRRIGEDVCEEIGVAIDTLNGNLWVHLDSWQHHGFPGSLVSTSAIPFVRDGDRVYTRWVGTSQGPNFIMVRPLTYSEEIILERAESKVRVAALMADYNDYKDCDSANVNWKKEGF